jgi:hypothetical protein
VRETEQASTREVQGRQIAQTISEKLIDGGVSPQDRVEDLNDLSAAKHLLIKRRPAAGIQAAGSSAELRRTISTAQRGL